MQTEPRQSSRNVREQMIGKCIESVIARPGRAGEPPMVMMMQFDDGSVLEFVSPRSDRVLRQALRTSETRPLSMPGQLAFAEI